MTASERIAQEAVMLWFSGHRRQLAKLSDGPIGEASAVRLAGVQAGGRSAPIAAGGGRPPLARPTPDPGIAHQRVQNSDETALAALLIAYSGRFPASLFLRMTSGEAAKRGGSGRGTGRGRVARPAQSPGSRALDPVEGGAGV